MSGEKKPFNPCDLFLPKDYEDDLQYRQTQPEINTDTSDDDDDGQKSRQTSPVNTIPDQPTLPNPFALLQQHLKMTNQGTSANLQQLGDGTNSVPLSPNIVNIAEVTDQFGGLTIAAQKASYLAPDDIVKKYRELEIQQQRDKLYNGKVICAILDFVKTLKDPPPEFDQFVADIKKDGKQVTQLCDSQELSLSKAKEISELYSQPIEYPTFLTPDDTVNKNQLNYAKSAKEIVTAVGIFDPSDKSHDFTQTWQVLLRYGRSNFFQEKDYIDALFHISRGDAKTILIEFDRLNKSLKQILEHFASIYSVRRSLVSDRRAVENFTRKKGELLEAAMHRYDIILDKIRHLHSTQAWPELSRNMKKVKLMQIIADETRIYIQNEEDDAIEATGMPYEFDKLVRLASKYERQHNKLPGENIQTVFDTSAAIPKNRKKQEDFIKQVVHEVLVNPVMTRDQSPKRHRDESRDRLDSTRTEQRRDRFNANRPISQEIFSPTQSSQSQSQNTIPSSQPSPAKPNPFQKSAEDRSAFLKAISRSPSPDRSQTPFTARGREREKRRERESSYPRQSARTPSFDKSDARNERNANYSQSSSQSYVTPGQRSDHSKERERRAERDSRSDKRNYNSGADRIKSQDRYFNARYDPRHDNRNTSRNHSPYNPHYPSSRNRPYSQERNHYRNDRNASNERYARRNSPYHNYGRNRSPSPYAYPQQRNSSLNRAHYVISEKAPKEILIRVSTQEIQTENH